LAPNTVGAQLKGMPYIKKGLARMPAMAKVIEPLDLTKFKDISAPLLTAQAAQYRRFAAVSKERGNMDNSIMYTEYAAALEGLAASVGQKQDEFLTSPIPDLPPEKVGRYLFLVQDYVDNPPAGATKEQLENAERRVATLNKLVQYDYDNAEFDMDLFLKDPNLYVAIRQKNPERFKQKDLPIVQKWAKSQVTAGIDFSKLSGADSLPMIDTYIDTIKGALSTTSKEDNPILYGKLVEQESLLKAKAKGIKDTLKPKELNLAVLGQNYFVAAAAETVAQEQMEKLGAKAFNETGGKIELAQHPEYRQSIQIYEEASATAQAEFENLERAVKINSFINPKEAKEYAWASNLTGIRAQQIQLTNQLGKATNEEQKRTLAEKIVMAKEIEAAYVETAKEQAAIKAQADIDAQGGIYAVGIDGIVQKFTPQEIEAGGLQRLGPDFEDKIQKATAQDSSKIQAATNSVEAALSVGSLSGEIADIISQDSRVLTQTANFVGFLDKVKAELQAVNSVTEQRVIELAQQENLLPFNAKADELDRLSDLNSRFNAKLIQLGFTAGASEGTSGNAMSNQDYNNLVRLISAGNTRNPATFLTNLNDYTQRRIAQANSMVNTTRRPGSSLFNTVDIAVNSDQARDALLKKLTPPDFDTFVQDNPTEFRVQNYQKLQQALDNAQKRQEGGTNLRQIMLLLRGSGLKGTETTEGLIQKSQVIDSQLKVLVEAINNNPAAKNEAIDTFKNYVGQTSGLQAPDLEELINLYINQPQQR